MEALQQIKERQMQEAQEKCGKRESVEIENLHIFCCTWASCFTYFLTFSLVKLSFGSGYRKEEKNCGIVEKKRGKVRWKLVETKKRGAVMVQVLTMMYRTMAQSEMD